MVDVGVGLAEVEIEGDNHSDVEVLMASCDKSGADGSMHAFLEVHAIEASLESCLIPYVLVCKNCM